MVRDVPISDVHVTGGVDAGISYSPGYANLNAAIAAGASMDELLKWEQGEYPQWFMARVVVWHRHVAQIDAVVQNAIQKKAKKKR